MRAGIVVVVLAAAGLAWWWLRDGASASPSPSRAQAQAASRRPTPIVPARTPAAAAPADSEADPTPVLDATHAAVHAIGRACWNRRTPREVPPGQPDDTVGRLELKMTVTVAGGQAQVAAAEVVKARYLTDELRDCIVDGVGAARWGAAAPDATYEITELFRMGDYVLRDQSTPPAGPPPR